VTPKVARLADPAGASESDPHVLGPGLLPSPFTADEIRQGCPDGRLIRIRVERDGELAGWRTNRFTAGDAEGTTLESRRFGADEVPAGELEADRVTWAELQAHTSFEAARTTRQPETIETPMGELDCLHYQRAEDDGSTSDFWFARSMPGMPIRYRNVHEGRVTSDVIVVESSLPESRRRS
jgi:hypothetical protein